MLGVGQQNQTKDTEITQGNGTIVGDEQHTSRFEAIINCHVITCLSSALHFGFFNLV